VKERELGRIGCSTWEVAQRRDVDRGC